MVNMTTLIRNPYRTHRPLHDCRSSQPITREVDLLLQLAPEVARITWLMTTRIHIGEEFWLELHSKLLTFSLQEKEKPFVWIYNWTEAIKWLKTETESEHSVLLHYCCGLSHRGLSCSYFGRVQHCAASRSRWAADVLLFWSLCVQLWLLLAEYVMPSTSALLISTPYNSRLDEALNKLAQLESDYSAMSQKVRVF
jgi:hypothetical protein